MSATFYQPRFFKNALLDEYAVSEYLLDGGDELLCLKEDCAALEPKETYDTVDSSVDAYGGWIPQVSGQTELNSNYAQVTVGSFTCYLFFKAVGSVYILHRASNLSNGYTNSEILPVAGQPSSTITTSNVSGAGIMVQTLDGPVIIIGILDTIDPKPIIT